MSPTASGVMSSRTQGKLALTCCKNGICKNIVPISEFFCPRVFEGVVDKRRYKGAISKSYFSVKPYFLTESFLPRKIPTIQDDQLVEWPGNNTYCINVQCNHCTCIITGYTYTWQHSNKICFQIVSVRFSCTNRLNGVE